MELEIKKNKIIALFENSLKRWSKNFNKENGIIFFPKLEFDNNKLIMNFPIFEKESENSSILVAFGKFNFENCVFSNTDKEIKNIITEELDYKADKYKNNLELLTEIIFLYKKLEKNNIENDEYKKEFNLLQESIADYKDLALSNFSQEIYTIYDKKENSIINQEKNTEELLNEDRIIVQKLKDFAKKYTTKQKYEFNMNAPNGLRYVSTQSLQLAYEILENNKISLKNKKEGNSNKIIITNDFINVCDKKRDTNQVLKEVKENPANFKAKNVAEFKEIHSLDYVCQGCKFQKCPKLLAGYIFYLINMDLLEEKLLDRENYRNQNEINEFFTFEWNFGNSLRYIPDDIFDAANRMVNEELVFVQNTLEKNSVKIFSLIKCEQFKVFGTDFFNQDYKQQILKKWTYFFQRPINSETIICRSHLCGLPACILETAGYIYYLRKLGKENKILEDRKFYHENRADMDDKMENIRNARIEGWEKNKEQITEKLKDYENKLTKLDVLADIIQNKNQSKFHCIIDGEDKFEKNNLINIIVQLLADNNKIAPKNVYKKSLQNLAATNAFCENYVKDPKNPENIDKNGVLLHVADAYGYTELKENSVYIINKISEFIEDYNTSRMILTSPYHEKRRKQFEHAIDLLTDMNSNICIILDGTTQEIENLISLDSRLKFIYQNYIFKLSDLSVDETFNLYVKNLDNDVLKILKNDYDTYKKQFIEYVSLNKTFMPFSSRELASYLAIYSNSKENVEFPENMYKKESIEDALKNIIGMDNVKTKVKEFENYMLFKVKAKANGLNLKSTNMHMIFTGNPGTGKTTIARIMAKMLFDLGIIKENKLVEVERKDLIANYIGQTASKTYEVIEKAMGGVLFIDEAYSLAVKGMQNDYGKEAISTLIKAMEDHKDNFVVIFAGYKDEMKTFLDTNPGIASRIGYTFHFPDYNADELVQIFYKKMNNMNFEVSSDAEQSLKKLCTYFSKKKDFGNGRFVDKIIQETIIKHSKNESENIKLIQKEDIPDIRDFNNNIETTDDIDKILENIVGLDNLKLKIKEFEKYIKFAKEAEKKNIILPTQSMHMIFAGNPGTGKTTIARIMGKILYDAGVIQENKLIEVEKKDLVANYVGQTASKTYEVIEKALGGILFIDEAYSLAANNSGSFEKEAIATLIKAMEDHKGEFIVIFAGYKKEMYEFINMNSGISSRIGYTFEFEDYNKEDLAKILYKKIEKSNMKITDKAKVQVSEIMGYFCNVENFGNGRFVDKVYQEILIKHSKLMKDIFEITEDDIPTIQEMTKIMFDGNSMIDPARITNEDLRKTAIHEIGHALTRCVLYEEPGIKVITINPEGRGTLGYVRHKGDSGYTSKKSELLNSIKVSLAGMAAEEEFLGEFENGNTSDLNNATNIARNMIVRFGMSSIGFGQIINSETGPLSIKVQEEINNILNSCYEETKNIIKDNKSKIEELVEYLLKNREINEEEFLNIYTQKNQRKTTNKKSE